MTLQDLIITPIFFILFLIGGYVLRSTLTTSQTKPYFIPSLLVKLLGAIALGLIYQFYYTGGDTFSYHTHGSQWIWKAFRDDFSKGIQLLTSNGIHEGNTFAYSDQIWMFSDYASMVAVKILAIFDFFTFGTYSASALFFAVFSFSGAWAMYSVISLKYSKSKHLHWAILYVPSVLFWGSGILKDTLTLGALSWLTWSMVNVIHFGRKNSKYWIIAILNAWLIYSVKPYIILCFLPTVVIWIYLKYIKVIKHKIIKIVAIPLLAVILSGSAYGITLAISTSAYNIDNIAQRAAITAYDIRYGWGARTGGDGGYDLGHLDGTWQSMLRLMPQAINVSLFRPYLWEVKNPLMLLSALEAIVILVLVVRIIIKGNLKSVTQDPFSVLCLSFALLFAFAVGVSTYNFGTLMRYKIPMMPFLLIVLLKAK